MSISTTSSRGSAKLPATVQLTAENTAIVLDSTADFPEGPSRFPNWRIVPLYVRFGAESHRDYVDIGPEQFYARLRTAEELPTTSQPTPADFLSAYEELSAFDRVLSLQLSSKISGTFESPGRSHRTRSGLGRTAHEHQADPHPRRGRGAAAQARARKPEGDPGLRRHLRGGDTRRDGTARRHRPCRGAGAVGGADEARPGGSAAGRDRGGDDSGAGARHARRARHRRPLLVSGLDELIRERSELVVALGDRVRYVRPPAQRHLIPVDLDVRMVTFALGELADPV